METHEEKVDCCIFIKESKEPVPLKEIKVSIGIRGYLVNLESSLIYENKGEEAIEAVFSFPVDENGSVYKFELEIDGKVVTAECQEKQEAQESYKEAVDQGYTACYMGENDSTSDIFTCKLGNLNPGKSALVRFAYVSELTIQEDGSLDFVLPTLLNPRYNPSAEKGGSVEVTKTKYVRGCNQPYTFELDGSVEGLGKILDITSIKDKLNVVFEQDNARASVKLSEKFVADHDFALNIKVEESHKPKVLIEKGKEGGEGLLKNDIMMLNFFPSLCSSSLTYKHEFIFVIDRSGSMDGSRIKDAKDSLLLFLKSLPNGCYFNIVGFGSDFKALFEEGSLAYSEENLKKALDYQGCLEADMGGTEILEPLQHIYKQALIPSHSRQILLITDGEVFNTSAIIRLVQSNSHSARVFTLGIGEGASTSLVKGVARAGKGKAEFVKSGDKMQPIVMRLLKCAMQVSVTNVNVDWKLGGSVELTQIPQQPPPIFDGDRLIIFAVINAPSVLDGRVVLRGEIGDEKIEYPVKVDACRDVLSSEGDSLLIHRMAAKVQIKQLQDSDDAEKKTNKAEIIALSLASNVISSYTAMVAIDKSNKSDPGGSMITCTISNVLDPTLKFPHMGFVGGACYGAAPMMACMASPGRTMMASNAAPRVGQVFCDSSSFMPKFSRKAGVFSAKDTCMDNELVEEFIDTHEEDSSSLLLKIISLVEFDGYWKFDDNLFALLSIPSNDVKKSSLVADLDVWSTALVLSYFRQKFADQKDEWEMIEMKTIQWMATKNLEGHSTLHLVEQAGKIIQ